MRIIENIINHARIVVRSEILVFVLLFLNLL